MLDVVNCQESSQSWCLATSRNVRGLRFLYELGHSLSAFVTGGQESGVVSSEDKTVQKMNK